MMYRGALAVSLAGCLAFLTSSSTLHAAPLNLVSGVVNVQCVGDPVLSSCVNGRVFQTFDRQGLSQQSGSASIENSYQIGPTGSPLEPRRTQAVAGASAGVGAVSAGATTSFVTRAGAPVFLFEKPTASATAFFRDEFTVVGSPTVVQTLIFNFSFGGTVFDDAGDTRFGPSDASAVFSASISGLDRAIFAGNTARRTLNDGLPSAITQGFRLSVDVVGGDRLRLQENLDVQSNWNATANFLSTGKLDYIEAPAGVSLLSASIDNVFIRSGDRLMYDTSGLVDPPAIPEPGIVQLWALGLVAAAFRIRRSIAA